MSVSQSAQSVLMVSPASFGFDEETASTNSFQVRPDISRSETTRHAMAEFDHAVDTLRQAGVDVLVHSGDPTDSRPDAVFPNNWLGTWPDGRVYLYPMAAVNRRAERDHRVLDQLAEQFTIRQTIDLSPSEVDQRYLESTGAIVFDHLRKVAYGCLSERCDQSLFTDHVEQLGYQPVLFEAFDQTGVPIYHTNVMMGVQSSTAVICAEAITDPARRSYVLELLGKNRQVIEITHEQMGAFCGNILEVTNVYGARVLVMSRSAYDAFSLQQRQVLSSEKTIIPIDIPTIEQAGGGSARCMLAEIFLPKSTSNDLYASKG